MYPSIYLYISIYMYVISIYLYVYIPTRPPGVHATPRRTRGVRPDREVVQLPPTTQEATQGQLDAFFSQLLYKFHLEEVASVGD